MAEITFVVSRQSDGWYLAAARHERIGGATEAPEYGMLPACVGEALRAAFSDGFREELDLPADISVRLQYEETLFAHAGVESIRIAGNGEGDGYGVHMRKPFHLNIHRRTVEELRDAVRKEIRQRDHRGKNVVFTLEETLSAEMLGPATTPRNAQSGMPTHVR